MLTLDSVLLDQGIVNLEGLYSDTELSLINEKLDPHFEKFNQEKRSYAYPVDLERLGLVESILSARVVRAIFDCVKDPVLYHFHVYEIAGNMDTPHIFANDLGGWHRDPDSVYEKGEITHTSLFVYLTDVDDQSGPFQFIPGYPEGSVKRGQTALNMTGKAGSSFFWHRRYFHRASPNKSSVRRRVMKLSFQPNRFPSPHLQKDYFKPVVDKYIAGDPWQAQLFGGNLQKTAPDVAIPASEKIEVTSPNNHFNIDISVSRLLKHRVREGLQAMKQDKSVEQYD